MGGAAIESFSRSESCDPACGRLPRCDCASEARASNVPGRVVEAPAVVSATAEMPSRLLELSGLVTGSGRPAGAAGRVGATEANMFEQSCMTQHTKVMAAILPPRGRLGAGGGSSRRMVRIKRCAHHKQRECETERADPPRHVVLRRPAFTSRQPWRRAQLRRRRR